MKVSKKLILDDKDIIFNRKKPISHKILNQLIKDAESQGCRFSKATKDLLAAHFPPEPKLNITNGIDWISMILD